jgi:hypothetical protein
MSLKNIYFAVLEEIYNNVVHHWSAVLLQSFNYTPYFFYKKRFKSEINSFCIWTLWLVTAYCA